MKPPAKPPTLEERLKARRKINPPTPEQWKKAFGGIKSAADGARDNEFLVYVDVQVTGETERALCVVGPMALGPCWLPKVVVGADSEVYAKGQRGKLVVARWFARKEGWHGTE